MREIRDILRFFELHSGEAIALATLVTARGSSYRRPGARMLICGDGTTAGSLSGGCLEEEVARRARDVIRDGEPALMSFDTRLRFGCNGSIDIFVERVDKDFLAELAVNFSERRSCRALTLFEGETPGTRFVRSGAIVPDGAFVQEIEPPIRLLIFGEGPDSLPLRAFVEILGWEVFEIDQPADLASYVDSRTAALVKSHNYGRDFAALCQLLKLDLPYVGLLGPRKRRDQLLNAVLDEGIAIDAEVFAPAGLDLGAETPEELALALVSEIQAIFAGASAESLRDRKAPIHGWNVVRRSAPKECATSPQ
ncbi:MAG TPA: XdhC family protein [Chthoniobacterales bacterium]|jgi:xanthine/CO dehydrogenase XdhC/CoxF family maturation factor|nr:XdhC family protein [Chthoniobacterales bacterium]